MNGILLLIHSDLELPEVGPLDLLCVERMFGDVRRPFGIGRLVVSANQFIDFLLFLAVVRLEIMYFRRFVLNILIKIGNRLHFHIVLIEIIIK